MATEEITHSKRPQGTTQALYTPQDDVMVVTIMPNEKIAHISTASLPDVTVNVSHDRHGRIISIAITHVSQLIAAGAKSGGPDA